MSRRRGPRESRKIHRSRGYSTWEPLTRTDMAALWSSVARRQLAAGDREAAAQSRFNARVYRGRR